LALAEEEVQRRLHAAGLSSGTLSPVDTGPEEGQGAAASSSESDSDSDSDRDGDSSDSDSDSDSDGEGAAEGDLPAPAVQGQQSPQRGEILRQVLAEALDVPSWDQALAVYQESLDRGMPLSTEMQLALIEAALDVSGRGLEDGPEVAHAVMDRLPESGEHCRWHARIAGMGSADGASFQRCVTLESLRRPAALREHPVAGSSLLAQASRRWMGDADMAARVWDEMKRVGRVPGPRSCIRFARSISHLRAKPEGSAQRQREACELLLREAPPPVWAPFAPPSPSVRFRADKILKRLQGQE
jgi:hypothetical protein